MRGTAAAAAADAISFLSRNINIEPFVVVFVVRVQRKEESSRVESRSFPFLSFFLPFFWFLFGTFKCDRRV